MALKDEILAKCSPDLIASRDESAIAAAVSAGRTAPNTLEIGKGTIIETIGIAEANTFLDVIDNAPDFRHIKQLVLDGRLKIGSPLVQANVQAMVAAGKLTQAHADALCALGVSPAPVSSFEIAVALEGM